MTESQIPILRVQTLAYAVCACKPSASVSPGPETTLPSPVRTRSHSIKTDARGAHPDHTSCSTAARAVPGCSSQGARVQATTARDRRRRICPGPCPPHPQKEADAECLPAARMANGTGRATRLTRSRPCGCYCYSALVRRKSIRYEGPTVCCVQLHRRMLRCTHMGSCESVVGAIAEAETAA